jgi:hypothetical protein
VCGRPKVSPTTSARLAQEKKRHGVELKSRAFEPYRLM